MRSRRGQVATALMLFIGVFVIGGLSVLAYEINMLMLAREQLKNCVQAAAAAGASSLASSADPADNTAKQNAKDTAINLFRENSILGQGLTAANWLASVAAAPPMGKSGLFVSFVDPISKQQVSGGTMLQVTGKYSYLPVLGQWIGLGVVTIPLEVSSNAGSPLLDLCLLYDITGSADDQTKVTYVQRYWDYTSTPPGISYLVPPDPSGHGPTMEGTLSGLLCAPPDGLNANASFPQGLENVMAGASTPPGCPVNFSEGNPSTKWLRGMQNAGAPPGNFVAGYSQPPVGATPMPPPTSDGTTSAPGSASASGIGGLMKAGYYHAPGSKVLTPVIPTGPQGPADASGNPIVMAGTGFPTTVTDVVVNLDGSTKFAGWNNAGFDFPTLGAAVEAARGNLDTVGNANGAGVDLGALGLSSIKPGYKNEYARLARYSRQPLNTIAEATQYFLNTMNQTGNVNFSLIPYNDYLGFCALCGFSAPQVSSLYAPGGSGSFALGLQLFNSVNNNYATISTVLPRYDNWGHRNTALAINTAIETLTQDNVNGITNEPRHYANKAIVLITNGVPDEKLDQTAIDQVAAARDARDLAKSAHDKGIPIYVIAVSQSNGLNSSLDAVYNDQNSNQATGGLAAISGMGAKYYRVDWTTKQEARTKLINIFGNIARNLVVLK